MNVIILEKKLILKKKMTDFNLIAGKDYQIIPKMFGLSHTKIYAMVQFLPHTRKKLETFVSVIGENNWRLFRTEISKENIRYILEGNLIFVTSYPRIIWVDSYNYQREPTIQEWLDKVKPILKKRGYENSKSFVDYFGL